MSNMMDYLAWRGDIPFSVDPFNEVDNFILSELVYTDFEGIVPGPEEQKSISIQQACDMFFSRYSQEEILCKVSSTKVAPFLMEPLAKSKRFRSLKLMGYVNEIDEVTQSQFSVVSFALEDGTIFVSFRGTDNTIVGWKEDFNMSFLHQTAGQLRAVSYLNQYFMKGRKPLRIGGHSKGGNFAVYSAAFCHEKIQKRMLQVYTNDGPGFCDDVIQSKEYQKILPKVTSILPESSIVGLLLENTMPHIIVKSNQTGAMQHDMMSWEILGNQAVREEKLNDASLKLEKTLKQWVYALEPEQRAFFVNTLFSSVLGSGITTIDEIQNNKMESFSDITKKWNELSPEKRKIMKQMLSSLAFTGTEMITDNMHRKFSGSARKTTETKRNDKKNKE